MPEVSCSQIAVALEDVIDPELGINIVDLGLLHGITVDGDRALLSITLTSPACPLTDEIEGQIFAALEGLIDDHHIDWVWHPPWSPGAMSEEGRSQARAIGLLG
jgi:metal-sulfur cluster biosynthetic enzyme